MRKDHFKSEIISLLDLYEQRLYEHDLSKAGDVYQLVVYNVLKKLTQEEIVFKQIVDELLFIHDKPHIQIEIATEAIGVGYRKEEAIQVLEQIATWTPDMSLQTYKGNICNTAQIRLHQLLGYSLDSDSQTWERTIEQEITPIYKKFFAERAKSGIDLTKKSVSFMNEEQQQIRILEITEFYPDDADHFLLACLTENRQVCYIRISSEGELLTVYTKFNKVEPFKNERSIVLTDQLTYGVIDKNGEYCIQPIYSELLRLNDYFYIGLHTALKGDLYHDSGNVIVKSIIPFEVIVNESETYIYRNRLYDKFGEVIATLDNIGTDWEATPDLGEYMGLNAANEVIYINVQGEVLSLHIDFETQFFLDRKGEVFMTTDGILTTLTMDGKTYNLDGEVYGLLKRFSDDHFIVRGQWSNGHYLWIDRKKKQTHIYQDVKCTNFDYWFAQKVPQNSSEPAYWMVMDGNGKTCVSEKKQIVHISGSNENNRWLIENTAFEESFFLPLKKKLMKKKTLENHFIKRLCKIK
jgi:hypothetical protein